MTDDWEAIRSPADLRDLMLRFLDGDIKWTAWHAGPLDPESEKILTELRRLTELGVITIGSQPGTHDQRAYVEAVVEDELVGLLRDAAEAHGYLWSENDQRSGLEPTTQEVVTFDDGKEFSWMTVGVAYPYDDAFIEGGPAQAVVRGMTAITVADPEWGSNAMWGVLIEALESRDRS